MSDRTKDECDLIVGGIKKVCHEKHVNVNAEINNMKKNYDGINFKLNGLYVLIIVEIIFLAMKTISG